MPSTLPGSVLRFGDFELDCGRFELRRKGHALRVERAATPPNRMTEGRLITSAFLTNEGSTASASRTARWRRSSISAISGSPGRPVCGWDSIGRIRRCCFATSGRTTSTRSNWRRSSRSPSSAGDAVWLPWRHPSPDRLLRLYPQNPGNRFVLLPCHSPSHTKLIGELRFGSGELLRT